VIEVVIIIIIIAIFFILFIPLFLLFVFPFIPVATSTLPNEVGVGNWGHLDALSYREYNVCTTFGFS